MCFRCDLGECQQVGSCIGRGSGSVKKFKSLLGVRKLNPLLVVDSGSVRKLKTLFYCELSKCKRVNVLIFRVAGSVRKFTSLLTVKLIKVCCFLLVHNMLRNALSTRRYDLFCSMCAI